MTIELSKTFDPKDAQQKWLIYWEERGYFHSEPDPDRKPFTIMIPPPNVTGALHMGHALNNTLQDVLIRWRRMQGYNTLWMPGTDHAGIATQSVVERMIQAQEKKTRHELGREELVKRIWQWKDKYESRILGQLREIGASCDWQRTRFTLDKTCVKAVRETFFKMFRDGYIYRGKRLVNWDTHLQTSVADDETYTENVKSGFWTFKYPVDGESDVYIRFSTTRPETMLGDTAICVHPADVRYTQLIGKHALQPLTGRKLPIIADGLLANPELGTGCVKVTPAHDLNDYNCYIRHPEIGIINILNPDGSINSVGGRFSGMDRYKAREAVIKEMELLGYYEGHEDRIIPLKFSDRSKTPIEPYLSDQWFVKMADREDGIQGLGQLTMDAVTDGRVKFYPERYAKTYLDWLSEKRDWCISRQLWWGHRIPVWSKSFSDRDAKQLTVLSLFTPDRQPTGYIESNPENYISISSIDDFDETTRVMVSVAPEYEAIEAALEADGWTQDPDVLDTWFSSALWPHSTLGWPGGGKGTTGDPDWAKMKYYYPTDVLVTNRDIITLWVARMVLTGLYNLDQVPFHHVYIHPKVMDAFGEGMSKTKGNGVDPIDIIEMYGTDAMRYGVVKLATEMQDARMPVSNVCPHCGTLVPVKQEHMYMRTKKLNCPNCKNPFRPGGPWPETDQDIPTAKQASDRFEEGKKFANKMWNAARYIFMNLDGYLAHPIDRNTLPTEDLWILSRLATTTQIVSTSLREYDFNRVTSQLYEFIWSEFCDWYIEISKGRLKDQQSRSQVQTVLVGVLDCILRLIQPVMPFLAETLWQSLNKVAHLRGLPSPVVASESATIAPWPQFPDAWTNGDIELRISRMQDLVRGIREIRDRYQIEEKTKLEVVIRADGYIVEDFLSLSPFIKSLAGVGNFFVATTTTRPKHSAGILRSDYEAYISLSGLVDSTIEIKRLEKQRVDIMKQLDAASAKLRNENFIARAPSDIITQQRELIIDLQNQLKVIDDNLKELVDG